MGLVRNHDHVNAGAFRRILTLFKMTISTQFVALQVLTTLHSTVEALNTATNNKAASQYVNCDCQCSSITFQDKFGRTQGNCKTADNTGATKPAQRLLVTALSAQDSAPPPTSSKG